MTLQSSGTISISQIKAELGSSSNSLRTLSAAAGKSAPDGLTEFYGYSSGWSTSFNITRTVIGKAQIERFHLNMSDTTVDMPSGGGGTYTLSTPYTHAGGGGIYLPWNSTAAHTRWTTMSLAHSNGSNTSISRSSMTVSGNVQYIANTTEYIYNLSGVTGTVTFT